MKILNKEGIPSGRFCVFMSWLVVMVYFIVSAIISFKKPEYAGTAKDLLLAFTPSLATFLGSYYLGKKAKVKYENKDVSVMSDTYNPAGGASERGGY